MIDPSLLALIGIGLILAPVLLTPKSWIGRPAVAATAVVTVLSGGALLYVAALMGLAP